MNILMLTFDYVPSPVWGMGTNVKETVDGLRKRGHCVTTVTVNRFAQKMEAVTVKCSFDERYNLQIGKCQCDIDEKCCLEDLYKATVNYIETNNIQYDIIHCHGWMMWSIAKKLSKVYHLPIVSTIHFLDKMYDEMNIKMNCSNETISRVRALESEMIHESDRLICISNFADGLLTSFYPDSAPHSIIYHGVHKRKRVNNGRAHRFLFVGRLTPEKGIDQLYKIFTELANYSLDVVGSGSLKPPAGVDNIHYLGQFPQRELLSLMENYDFIILPYLYELFGLVLIEGVSCGCIPIISNQGSLDELSHFFKCVKFSITNNIIDKDSFKNAIKNAVELQREDIYEVRNYNYNSFERLFTTDSMIENIIKTYKELLSR